ncbi:hypothetical protein L7F22_050922 [Adiantum nelumboides]|nr:hypothetical protein [Adiantum nelumboides]
MLVYAASPSRASTLLSLTLASVIGARGAGGGRTFEEVARGVLEVAQDFEKGRRSFDGVPVFQSNNLIVRSNGVRFSPVFFCKEDLEKALQTASLLQQKINPSLPVNIDMQVGSLEHVLKQMEGSINEQDWGDIVFIPPAMTALGQLGNVNKTTMG